MGIAIQNFDGYRLPVAETHDCAAMFLTLTHAKDGWIRHLSAVERGDLGQGLGRGGVGSRGVRDQWKSKKDNSTGKIWSPFGFSKVI